LKEKRRRNDQSTADRKPGIAPARTEKPAVF